MIDELPANPDPAVDPPAEFSKKAAASVLAQKVMVTQMNAALAQFNAALAGGVYALPYVFDSATADADPGPGKLRLSSSTQNAATTIRLDTTVGGQDYTSVIDTFDASTSSVKGSIRLVKMGDLTKWLTFDVTARAAPTGYRNITVTNTGGSAAGPFTNGDGIMLFFQRTGDAGVTGFAKFSEQLPQGTNAGGSSANAVVTRGLNTIDVNGIGATLSASAFTLQPGKYVIQARAPAYQVGGHRLYLNNVTDSSTAAAGPGALASATQTDAALTAYISISSAKAFSIRHRTTSAQAANGLGIAMNYTGESEIYTEVNVWRLA
jgi:hypothetical protein